MDLKDDESGSILEVSVVSISHCANKIYIGIDWSYFFDIYISSKTTSETTFIEIFLLIENVVTHFVETFRSNNIEPICFFDGIIREYLSYSYSLIIEDVNNIFARLNVLCIFAPSNVQNQLAFFYNSGIINAIFSNSRVSLCDVVHWISYIDFESMDAVISTANQNTIMALLRNKSALNIIFGPCDNGRQIVWNKTEGVPIIPHKAVNKYALSCLCSGMISAPRIPRPPLGSAQRNPFITLPRNCLAFLNDVSDMYFSLFRNYMNINLSEIILSQESPRIDEFLPLMLQQNPLTTSVEVNQNVFRNILAAQNIISRSFTTLFDTMHSITSSESKSFQVINDNLASRVITEAICRFLTAHEYIAPGGGLSPWGRAIINSNSRDDMPTLAFIEMVRADAMDAEVDSIPAGGVGVTDIIERTFMLFPAKTKPPACRKSKIDLFRTITRIIMHSMNHLFKIIVANTYFEMAKNPSINELGSIISQLQFFTYPEYQTGTLIRFLLEATEDRIEAFIDEVDDYELFKSDVKAAYEWWNGLQRATKELKQRSLRPNARVSNLKNFLILFECADQFVQRRMAAVRSLIGL